ncbi:pyrimidine-nucleoside phosphorylase [Frankia sp. R43]|uniref:thymidine phosphorylase n=1 Tax=Frankia sp. R43 TaxID=269536 RepID=UPI0006CA0574|nr:thymidine phosphorylase [Frankia sp. R43]KPM51371.1 pyrimidine-nucleoside phosphorylase [Frankia sp. R43]
MSAFDVVDLIRAKRDGAALPGDAIAWLLDSYTGGRVADEQMAAYLMAVCWHGMTEDELDHWTAAMIASGERLDLTGLPRPTVDKHSTGGVGDKVSLVLVPLVVACGAAVPQAAGRGLGYTGGTLDKMEAIPGWRADLDAGRMRRILAEVGGVICAAGAGLAPADRRLYALRDVTGTVESIPLIASSIMSKKIAEGTSALVLDVKVGSGAFMTSVDDAHELARTMVRLGTRAGVRTEALITAMDTPLGRTAGNGPEVAEAVETLRGGGPADLAEITVALARIMLDLAGLGPGSSGSSGSSAPDPAAVLASGAAHEVWRAMVTAQGGDPDAALPTPAFTQVVPAPASGFLSRLEARAVGVAAWRLGAGRARKEDAVAPAAGLRWFAGVGEEVRAGEPLIELYSDDESTFPRAVEALAGAVSVTRTRPASAPLVLAHIR